MRLIEKYIEWLVAIALSFACCFDVIKQGLHVVDAKGIYLYFRILNDFVLVCLVIYLIISLTEYRCSALTIPRGAHSEYRS